MSLIMHVLIEQRRTVCISVINAENTMSPTRLNESLPLTKEYLLSLYGAELLKVVLDLLELGTSLCR